MMSESLLKWDLHLLPRYTHPSYVTAARRVDLQSDETFFGASCDGKIQYFIYCLSVDRLDTKNVAEPSYHSTVMISRV